MSDEFYKLYTDPNYIALKRFGYSLEQLLQRYPDGCPDRVIAQALLIPEEEVEEVYQSIVQKLRDVMLPEEELE